MLYKLLSRILVFIGLMVLGFPDILSAQDNKFSPSGIKVAPQLVEGAPIQSILILLNRDGQTTIADSLETDAFYKAFYLRPGAYFRQSVADLAIKTIDEQSMIRSSAYELYNSEIGGPLVMVVQVNFLARGELKSYGGKMGMSQTKTLQGFPVISETSHSKLMVIFNGGVGLFNENNTFFGQGEAFTKGNPIASNPAGKGVRFWGETYLEPGLAGIWQLGKSRFYAYGAASLLVSARNTSDIYSEGATIFADAERLYAGVLAAGLGKRKNINIDASFGRQFFQLDDGFLISKFSGSANAGERGSVYLNSRTAFQKTAIVKSQVGKFNVDAFYVEPEELNKNKQSNTGYAGGRVGFNNNKKIDVGITYITVPGGTSRYSTPQGSIAKKGMYILNPKLYLTNIGGTGLFFKSEYAYQSHYSENMRSKAYYLGGGIKKEAWKFKPSLYYRYAFMQGDDSLTSRYEKFDPVLTGGLGNWVQGIDFRKLVGNGNIISHRVELKGNISSKIELSLDYFLLKSHTLSNLGALAPISKLKNKNFGQEYTLTGRYFINNNFLLLVILSHAQPGNAIQYAFTEKVFPWTSVQTALFMFF